MKPYVIAGLGLATLLVGTAGQADAAWNNVFQVTCFGCKSPPTTARYLAVPAPVVAQSAPSCCAPQPSCTTRYVQRSYYQPVTVMQTQSYYEPVTSYQTSYYYESVTSYRYSSYYDPCSCSYQQVATPVCGYELRSKSCPVQSWVQRCAQVPVTTYQKACYWEPQTTCCNTTIGAPVGVAPAAVQVPVPAAPPPGVMEQRGMAPPPAAPPPAAPPPAAPPGVMEQRSTPPPPVVDQKYDRYYPPEQGSYQQLPKTIQPITPSGTKPATSPPPQVKLERIVFGPEAKVEGQVVRTDRTPTPGAKVLFVCAQRQTTQQEVTANGSGQFHAELPAGGWLVYVSGPDGRQVFHSRIEVGHQNATPLTLVSR